MTGAGQPVDREASLERSFIGEVCLVLGVRPGSSLAGFSLGCALFRLTRLCGVLGQEGLDNFRLIQTVIRKGSKTHDL